MSARKASHGTIFLIVSSGSPLALIASSRRSTSKKPFCPMTRSLHPPATAGGQRVRFAATWRDEFFEVPSSLSRPGGQVTGIFFDFPDFSRKWLELLKEAIPTLNSIAILWEPATGPVHIKAVEIAAKELKVKVETMDVPGISNLDDAIFAASSKGVDAILMLSSTVIGANQEYIAGLTLGLRLPAMTLFPDLDRKSTRLNSSHLGISY